MISLKFHQNPNAQIPLNFNVQLQCSNPIFTANLPALPPVTRLRLPPHSYGRFGGGQYGVYRCMELVGSIGFVGVWSWLVVSDSSVYGLRRCIEFVGVAHIAGFPRESKNMLPNDPNPLLAGTRCGKLICSLSICSNVRNVRTAV